jgi:hypothetical protein
MNKIFFFCPIKFLYFKMNKKKEITDILKKKSFGGCSIAFSRTITAPMERVKIIIQTQDANLKIRSGEVPRYNSVANTFIHIYKDQSIKSFWRGNFTKVFRYFLIQGFNFVLKDINKTMFPIYNPRNEFGTQKMLKLLREDWAPSCFLVTSKLLFLLKLFVGKISSFLLKELIS